MTRIVGSYRNFIPTSGIFGFPGKQPQQIGLIYRDTFSSTQRWGTPVGAATWVTGSGGVTVSGSSGTFLSNYLPLNTWTNTLEKWKMVVEFVVVTRAAGGFCMGIQSIITSATLNRTWLGRFATTGTQWGLNTTTFLEGTGTTGTGLNGTAVDAAYSVNDVIHLEFERDGITYTTRATNVTTGISKSTSYTLTIPAGDPVAPNNAGVPILMSVSGSQRLTYFELSSTCYKNVKALFIGASNTCFLRATSYPNLRYPNRTFINSNEKFEVMAGGNDRVRAYTPQLEMMKLLNADYTFLEMGSNDSADVANAVQTDPVWRAGYMQIVDNIIKAKSTVIHLTPIPRGDLNLRPLVNWIYETFPTHRVINLWEALRERNGYNIHASYNYGDNLHLNDVGHYVAARTILDNVPGAIDNKQGS